MNIPKIKVPTDTLWEIGPIHISNAMFTTWIVMLLLLVFAYFVKRNAGVRPSRLQVLFEVILEYILEKATQAFGTEERAKKYFPLLFTIFLFLLIANQLSLVPLIAGTTLNGADLFRLPASHYSLPLTFALLCLLLAHGIAIAQSPIRYIGNYFKFHLFFKMKSIKDLGMVLIEVFLGLMDIIGEVAKLVSVATRLFGNLFAGGVVISIISGLTIFTSFIVPMPFVILGILSGAVQAFVFTILLTIYMSGIADSTRKPNEVEKQLA